MRSLRRFVQASNKTVPENLHAEKSRILAGLNGSIQTGKDRFEENCINKMLVRKLLSKFGLQLLFTVEEGCTRPLGTSSCVPTLNALWTYK